MSSHTNDSFDTDAIPSPHQSDPLSANAHWIFGSIYAALAFVGFAFGVWAGAPKSKPLDSADAKQPAPGDKPGDRPAPKPPANPVAPNPGAGAAEPKPKEPSDKPSGTTGDKPGDKPAPKTATPTGGKPAPKPGSPGDKPAPKTGGTTTPGTTPAATRVVLFKEVQPILRTHCNDCHGGSTGKPKGGVDTTTIAKMLASKGMPLIPGKPDESSIYTTTKSGEMPKDRKGPTQKEIELLRDWIAGGAKERRRTGGIWRGRRPGNRRKLELTHATGPG